MFLKILTLCCYIWSKFLQVWFCPFIVFIIILDVTNIIWIQIYLSVFQFYIWEYFPHILI